MVGTGWVQGLGFTPSQVPMGVSMREVARNVPDPSPGSASVTVSIAVIIHMVLGVPPSLGAGLAQGGAG